MTRLIGIIEGFALAAIVFSVLLSAEVIELHGRRVVMPAERAPLDMHPLFTPCDRWQRPNLDRMPMPPLPMEGTH